MKLPQILTSKKAQATILGILAVVLGDAFGLEPEQVQMIVGLVASYIFGQGVADHGKEKAYAEKA